MISYPLGRKNPIMRRSNYGQVAQSVEQGTENPCVGGSIPPLGTIIIPEEGLIFLH